MGLLVVLCLASNMSKVDLRVPGTNQSVLPLVFVASNNNSSVLIPSNSVAIQVSRHIVIDS